MLFLFKKKKLEQAAIYKTGLYNIVFNNKWWLLKSFNHGLTTRMAYSISPSLCISGVACSFALLWFIVKLLLLTVLCINVGAVWWLSHNGAGLSTSWRHQRTSQQRSHSATTGGQLLTFLIKTTLSITVFMRKVYDKLKRNAFCSLLPLNAGRQRTNFVLNGLWKIMETGLYY